MQHLKRHPHVQLMAQVVLLDIWYDLIDKRRTVRQLHAIRAPSAQHARRSTIGTWIRTQPTSLLRSTTRTTCSSTEAIATHVIDGSLGSIQQCTELSKDMALAGFGQAKSVACICHDGLLGSKIHCRQHGSLFSFFLLHTRTPKDRRRSVRRKCMQPKNASKPLRYNDHIGLKCLLLLQDTKGFTNA